MFNLSSILLILAVAVTFEYEFKCPESGEWRLRAIGFNCSIISQYVCIFRYPEREYHETCDGLDYSNIGSKLIYEPFFNKAYCSYERYQPFPFSTDGSSKCVYQKSFCTEKGQYIFQRGSQRSDITCGCDLTRGYEFVNKPKHECYCVPSEDDCSCHKLPCNKLVDQCSQDGDEIIIKSMVTALKENRFNDAVNIFDNENNGKKYRFQCLYITSVLLAVMIMVVTLFFTYWEHQQVLREEDINRLNMFNKLMQSSKVENRYFVKLVIVGKGAVGKTSLLKRLLNEDISRVTSTDGIDIVVRRCKINIDDGTWTISKDIGNDKVHRIQRALIANAKDTDTKKMQVDETKDRTVSHRFEVSTSKKDITTDTNLYMDGNEDKNKTPSLVMPEDFTTDTNINLDNNEDKKKTPSLVMPADFTTNTKINLDNNEDKNESSTLVMPEDLLIQVFSRSTVKTTQNIYALCELWDFAGQKEFYATHQAFLTSCAVYLVVADMKNDISKQGSSHCFADFQYIGEYVDFWFDYIHCYRTADKRDKYGHLDPPIILVFTGKDKYLKADFIRRKRELDIQIDDMFGNNSKYKHLHCTFYLSNLTDTDEEFDKLRYTIYETAEKMDIWGKACPLKWILLEHLIEINKNDGINFISFTEMLKLAKHSDINLQEEVELLLFLRFQHNIGHIMFFENIQDLIILNPQWLADAFRCLVSDRFDIMQFGDDWTLLIQQGILSESLITMLFESKLGTQFLEQKENLCKIMEKLDILVKIGNSQIYIVPSHMLSSTHEQVLNKFGILKEDNQRSSWLCMKFDFLPPSFFNHLSVYFIRKYAPSEEVGGGYALYRGICIFDIDGNGDKKIIVTMSTDIIALQVVLFSESNRQNTYTYFDLIQSLQKI